MKKIYLTKMRAALVDDEDYEELNKYKWSVARIGKQIYAVRGQTRQERGDDKRRLVYMHQQVLQAKPDDRIKHRNGNGLDNTKRNLIRNDRFEIYRDRPGFMEIGGVEIDMHSPTFIKDLCEATMSMLPEK